MTTSDAFQVVLAPDLFQPNECVNPPWSGPEPHPALAAITLMLMANAGDHRADLIWVCVQRACSVIANGLPSYQPWLCASEWGENTRVSRYHGLWRRLATCGFRATMRSTPETSLEIDGDSIGFYGAAELERERIEGLRPIVTPASRSFLSWMPPATVPDVNGMVAAGWSRGLSDLRELAKVARVLSAQGGIVLRLFGQFDDRETGVDCITNAENYAVLSTFKGE
jgi:hypothetical protein